MSVVVPPPPSSGEARLTEFDKFAPICAKYGTTPQAARIVICKGRKVGFVLAPGTVTGANCFLNERATKSTKDSQVYDMTLIPHGWKVAVEVKRMIYVGETMIRGGNTAPLYRFSRIAVDTGEVVDQSDFKEHPTPAFTEVSVRSPVAASSSLNDAERPNGKLYMGVQYTEPQQLLRSLAAATRLQIAPEAMSRYQAWFLLQPSPSSSAPAASAALENSPKFAGGKRKLASSLEQLDSIVQQAIGNKEAIRNELDFVSSRPSKLQRDGSARDAMQLLRENSLELSPEDLDFDRLEVREPGRMSAEALFYAFKQPDVNYLNLAQMKRAMETLLQMQVPKRLVDEMFAACDRERTGRVTLQNFVGVIQRRDEELWQQFCRIDFDGDGEITLDELRLAKERGIFSAQEREINTLLDAMDRVSSREGDLANVDQKIQWHEFRAMMVLLPPASTIQDIVDVVKSELEERDLLHQLMSNPVQPQQQPQQAHLQMDDLNLFRQQQQQQQLPPPHPSYPPPQQQQQQHDYLLHDFMDLPLVGGVGMPQQQQQQAPAMPAFLMPPVPAITALSRGSSNRLPGVFERSPSFQQYLVRSSSNNSLPPPPTLPAQSNSSQFAALGGSGHNLLQNMRDFHGGSGSLRDLNQTLGGSNRSISNTNPYREIFGRDDEFEHIFEQSFNE